MEMPRRRSYYARTEARFESCLHRLQYDYWDDQYSDYHGKISKIVSTLEML